MNSFHIFFILFFVTAFEYGSYTAQELPSTPIETTTENIKAKQEKKISEYILKVLDHYKQEDPVGIPGAPIPDPMDIPDLKHSFSVGTMNMKNVKLYGLPDFRIEHVRANIAEMKVEAALTIKTLTVKGNYTWSAFFSSAKGPFTVVLTDVHVEATAMLEVERNGTLEAQDMSMDITFNSIAMDFKNLGFVANMLQGIMNSVGTFVFDSIKPFVLKEVNTNMRKDINKQVRNINQTFPNSISPFDQLMSEIRRNIRRANCDPYKIPDYNTSVGIVDVFLRNTWVNGLSQVYRNDEIVLEIKNHSVHAFLDVGTQRMEGRSNWEVSLIAGVVSRAGTVAFTVDYFKVEVEVSQSMDTRNSPIIEDIQLELGNIQVRFEGAGTLDYAIELAVNVLPNLLRYQIMDAIEGTVKQRVQTVLNTVNIERIVKEYADKIDDPKTVDVYC